MPPTSTQSAHICFNRVLAQGNRIIRDLLNCRAVYGDVGPVFPHGPARVRFAGPFD